MSDQLQKRIDELEQTIILLKAALKEVLSRLDLMCAVDLLSKDKKPMIIELREDDNGREEKDAD